MPTTYSEVEVRDIAGKRDMCFKPRGVLFRSPERVQSTILLSVSTPPRARGLSILIGMHANADHRMAATRV